jgi:CRP-like cAMP-binding protein
MPQPIKVPRRDERLVICRLLVSMTKELHASVYGDDCNFGAHLEALFVGLAVLIGHGERKPMNATKVALYLGMPRPTVLRKLEEFIQLGIIVRRGNYYFISPTRMANDDHVFDALNRLLEKHVAGRPPKMDGQ